MKIFIYLPNWLGDATMAAGAINLLKKTYKECEFVFYGSYVACALYENLGHTIIEDKKNRLKQFKNIKEKFDIAISFKASFSSKFLFLFIKAKKKLLFNKEKAKQIHQVLKYANLLKKLNINYTELDTSLAFKKLKQRNFIAIAPGAKYGSAKCYEPKYFAQIAASFKGYKVLLFGVKSDEEICKKIEEELNRLNVKVINLCSKTSIKRLILALSSCKYLLANDSGIMHIGAALNIRVFAFFGATNILQTSPFSKNAQVFSLKLDCSPCMKRLCPLKHHNCMKQMTADLVLNNMKLS
ncbi:lipopolysaccharide heptosyltransferase II [Campylobacter canadensis]|uniref:lipopolysaccharide heptosyltransferase II n=1 Tax=Campylobacter canadensis TaxID=449520 RepID=A0ABS7WTP6_9BACT|nr:lipopolysaccharide heptosyltransferase II [Campylobacter canadensis]MBZ7987672.1 lipopolysaccharide heptosyltransferase II [Campylobacter canadensis]MBZ7995005.1 lipopolysaccharide heptosyltransferase II [Campylobacter canadensis]MBZ7996947.1 lipopolysaccharide heptosyltransferase II [Campylobacter canadensis]MBZ7998791.1 lipopolysaccharide heptosyltransferase II [Campylobacter canadensis]MBZ8000426.1 lipopolysaccharide heptosyltransferase II [Campylobacter canadensis]